MGIRRFTRLTNGFSKKVENHGASVALYFMHYNFCRIHRTLGVTPAIEAGLTDHVWTIEEMHTSAYALMGTHSRYPVWMVGQLFFIDKSVEQMGMLF